MGQITEMKLAAFAEATGVKPATGRRAEILEQMSVAAFELIKVIELERSGIRHGDGYWYVSSEFCVRIGELRAAMDALIEINRHPINPNESDVDDGVSF